MRASGVLMHISSLPGDFGIGTMGKEAFSFVDFLRESGQSYWQILPLSPTGYGDSPYQSCSAFAGNPYLIDLALLVEAGLLKQEELTGICWGESDTKVDFGKQYENRMTVLRLAYNRFTDQAALDAFCRDNASWLSDFALFMALKEHFGGKPWYQWEDGLKHRDPGALWQARQSMKETIRLYSFVQYLFFTQWENLRDYAHKNGVKIIGDVPIYVPYDSCEVWCDPELFRLDDTMTPTEVAGCPPDAFSEDGQLWGNPLYRWDVMAKDGYRWWIRRLGAAQRLYDVVRMDHFRGLESFWAVPYGDATAKNGCWMKGPGMDFIDTIRKKLPEITMIAEDLGFLTQEVLDLRDNSGFPGMKVLEFAFYEEDSPYQPHNYEPNCICYIGTHDNEPMVQWLQNQEPEVLDWATRYMCLSDGEGQVWGAVRTAMSSVAKLCIFQMQDLLELGGEARMNAPGILSDSNWTWRMKSGAIVPEMKNKLLSLTKLYGRAPKAGV